MSQEQSYKLQQVLAQANIASRRKAEQLIASGAVMVNGQLARIGQRVSTADTILVHGVKVEQVSVDTPRLLMYHKPLGEVCSRQEKFHQNTVFRNLPVLTQGRWVVVGRLDINTSGLLLFTNSGALANKFMHPRYKISRSYLVQVSTDIDDEVSQQMLGGVQHNNELLRFDEINRVKQRQYQVTLSTGRNREVRRIWQAFGIRVMSLVRTQFGAYKLPAHLKPGHWLELDIDKNH